MRPYNHLAIWPSGPLNFRLLAFRISDLWASGHPDFCPDVPKISILDLYLIGYNNLKSLTSSLNMKEGGQEMMRHDRSKVSDLD